MEKQKWAVRVVFFKDAPQHPPAPTPGQVSEEWVRYKLAKARAEAKFDMMVNLLEQLRYAGLARELAHLDVEKVTERLVFEFYCPEPNTRDTTRVWAEANARRMVSMGYCAAAAPVWGTTFGLAEDARTQGVNRG